MNRVSLYIISFSLIMVYSFRSFHVLANGPDDTRELVEISGRSVKDIKFGRDFIIILTNGKITLKWVLNYHPPPNNYHYLNQNEQNK